MRRREPPQKRMVLARSLRQDGAMNENPWTRLSRITYARLDHLGIDQEELHALHGGPSSAWVRRIKTHSGAPSAKTNKSLRQLSLSLGWTEGTARSILTDDRSDWTARQLQDEENDLIERDAPAQTTSAPDSRSIVKRIADAVRSDPMAGVTDEEWADLLDAIESKMSHHNSNNGSGKRPHRKTGT
jgi:hypothetical protein